MKLLLNRIGGTPIPENKYVQMMISFCNTLTNSYKKNVLPVKASSFFDKGKHSFKIDLKMKLSAILLIFGAFALQANLAYSQKKISINLSDVTVERLLDEIESKTDFRFIYSTDDVDVNRKVSVMVDSQSVNTILQEVFSNTGTSFNIEEGQIFLLANNNFKHQNKTAIRQTRIRVTGTVNDEDGIPLNGASVIVQGTTIGVSTDFDGRYVILVPNQESVLEFSYIGYEDKQITVGGQFSINVVMKEAAGQLDEVILNAGYYKTSKKVATGNIAKITAIEIDNQPVLDPIQAIQGRIPGVQITQSSGTPGTNNTIRIRGLNSLNDGRFGRPNANLPLYVINGVPVPSTALDNLDGSQGVRAQNPLTYLNPADIEDIQILKDADATAIYGSRGANGVILITTKQGKPGKTTVDFEYSRGFLAFPHLNKIDLLNTEQYLAMRREGLVNDGSWPVDPADQGVHPDLFLWDQDRNVDWRDELLGGVGEQINGRFSVNGGSEYTNFNFSANYSKQTNIYNFDDSAFKTGSGLLNVNHRAKTNGFNVALSARYGVTENNQNAPDLTSVAFTLAPNAPELFDENGNINFEGGSFTSNPLIFIAQESESTTRNFIGNAVLGYDDILPGLNFKSVLGYTATQTDRLSLQPLRSRTPQQISVNGTGGIQNTGTYSAYTWIVEPELNYTKDIGRGTLILQVGTSFQSSTNEGLDLAASGYDSDLLIRDIGAAPEIRVTSNTFNEYRYNAVYGRINYNHGSRYILNLTGRRDGSSRFGPGKQWGNFGAIGGAWIFSEENFVKNNLSFLSFGKLRGSYGITGNDGIGDYGYLATYEPNVFQFYNGSPGLLTTRAANPDYSWEENKKLEIALDLGLFNDRVRLDAAFYRNRSSNQLIGLPLSVVTGFNSLQFNLPALVENKGLEFTLNTTNVRTKDFLWTTGFNITKERNELLEFPDIESFPAFDNLFEVGESLLGQKEYSSLGVDTETGLYNIVDVNGDGAINGLDRQDFIDTQVDFYGGLNNSLSYKGIQFDVFFRFVKQQGYRFITGPIPGVFRSGQGNQAIDVQERWQSPGDSTPFQQFTSSTNSNSDIIRLARFDTGSARNLTDASFLRLQNVSLAYNLPKIILDDMGVSAAKIYVQGQNLATITPYNGIDPETRGIRLPPLRTIIMGLQLTF